MHGARSEAGLAGRFHCSPAKGCRSSTQPLIGGPGRLLLLLHFGCWMECRACMVMLVSVRVVVLVRPGGGSGLRGVGQQRLLEGAGGQQGCSTQLGTVCRHGWGGLWAMLPAGGPSAPSLHHATLPRCGGQCCSASSGGAPLPSYLTHRWILASSGTPWKAVQASWGTVQRCLHMKVKLIGVKLTQHLGLK